MAALFADGFETGDTSLWSAEVGAGAHVAVSGAAALVGSYGLAITIADTTAHGVQTNTSNGKKVYRCRFYFDPNSLAMANAEEFMLIGHAYPQPWFLKLQYYTASGYRIFDYVPYDSGGGNATANITDAPHYIEVNWGAATSAGANNGYFEMWIDGVSKHALTSLDNDTKVLSNLQLGAIAEIDAGTSGTFYIDAFYSNDTGVAIGATDPSAGTPIEYYARMRRK